MVRNYLLSGALGLSLSISPLLAQTAAEQLQKAIYAQETAGDIDGAIQLYRQLAVSSQDHRDIAAQAQLRLAQSLLQKGDLSGAALEFGNLARNYSEYGHEIAAMAASGRMMVRSEPSIVRGTLQNGRYHHNLTGVEFSLTPGWTLQGDGASSGDGEMAILSNSGFKTDIAAVWMKHYDNVAVDIPQELRQRIEQKLTQRTEFRGYKIRPESIQPRTFGGHQALTAVADYEEGGNSMAEYLTWVRSAKTVAFFFCRMAASDLPVAQARFDPIIQSVYIPQD